MNQPRAFLAVTAGAALFAGAFGAPGPVHAQAPITINPRQTAPANPAPAVPGVLPAPGAIPAPAPRPYAVGNPPNVAAAAAAALAADEEKKAIADLTAEIAAQQIAIADNQKQIDTKLAVIAENIRLARIFASRGGGAPK